MELRQLLTFREVVRQGSFTAAARALHMTQPAVSLQVKALEDELGARLFDRDGRGVRLTPAGSLLLQTADGVLSSVDEVARRITEMQQPERGTLVLACGDTVALRLLPPILAEFRALRPHADIVIRNHGSRTIVEKVLRREVDLGIATRPPWLDPAIWSRTLMLDPLRIALPREHPLAAQDPLDPAALADAPAVLLAKATETRAVLNRGLRRLGVRLRVVMESENLEVVKHYVAAGTGITFLPEMSITPEDRTALVIRPLPADFPARRIAVIRRRDRPAGLLTADLLRLLGRRFRPTPEERAAAPDVDD